MTNEEFSKFVSELVKYYKLSMGDIAKSINKLAEIEEMYPKEYERFKEVSQNPEMLINLEMSNELKSLFFEILLKSASLTQKMGKLITLTPTEKKVLAKDLNDYALELEKKITEIK